MNRSVGTSPVERYGRAVGLALTERKVPDDVDIATLTDRQKLEATADLLDRLDDATDALTADVGIATTVDRAMQADLRRIAETACICHPYDRERGVHQGHCPVDPWAARYTR
jgi:hypothetical protein